MYITPFPFCRGERFNELPSMISTKSDGGPLEKFSAESFSSLELCQPSSAFLLFFLYENGRNTTTKARTTQKYKTNRAICPAYESFPFRLEDGFTVRRLAKQHLA